MVNKPPPIKLQHLTIKSFERKDIVLHQYSNELDEAASKECGGQKGGFAWLNKHNALADKMIPQLSSKDLCKVDIEVQKWNERELPPSEQFK